MAYPAKNPAILELESIFQNLNSGLFGSRFTTPTFVIHTEKKFLFRFDYNPYHIIIGRAFGRIQLDAVIEHLLHEMAHMANAVIGLRDCTANQYHNKKFLIQALRAGLYVLPHKTHGWGITKFEITDTEKQIAECPDEKELKTRIAVVDKIKKKVNWNVLNQAKLEIKSVAKKESRKVFFLKYECGCLPPHNSIRSGRRPNGEHPLNAICNDCGQLFKCVAKE